MVMTLIRITEVSNGKYDVDTCVVPCWPDATLGETRKADEISIEVRKNMVRKEWRGKEVIEMACGGKKGKGGCKGGGKCGK